MRNLVRRAASRAMGRGVRRVRGASWRGLEVCEPRVMLSGDAGGVLTLATAASAVAVTSYRLDPQGLGVNDQETTLTPGNIGSDNFALRLTTPVDGQVYAEPLVVPGVTITAGGEPGVHNVVYVATEHDSLYAIDVNSGNVLWQDSFINPANGVTTVPYEETGSTDLQPEIGITSTPIIDTASGKLYLEAKAKEVRAGDPVPHYVQRLYTVDMGSGASSSVVIADTSYDATSGTYTYNSGPYVLGTGDGAIMVDGQSRVYFNALRQMVRPGLAINNGNLYILSASHGDNGPYHGWVLSYDVSTMTLDGVFNATPNGGLGGLWQGGGVPVFDSQGYMYVQTGNGNFNQDPSNFDANGFPKDGDYGDSVIKIGIDPATTETNQNVNGWGLKAVDYFTPFNQGQLDVSDMDLGSGGTVVLPDSVGSAAHPHLLLAGGKEGKVYLIDRDNMGKFDPKTDHVVQELAEAVGGILSTPSYFNGAFYEIGSYSYGLVAYSISNGHFNPTPIGESNEIFGHLDGGTFISANGTQNGIVWALDRGTNELRAYDASNFHLLYTSDDAGGRDQFGSVVKFSVPTVTMGRVFVGTEDSLAIFGPPQPPTTPPADPTNLAATPVFPTEVDLTWTDNAINEDSYEVERSPDGVDNWSQLGAVGVNNTTYKDTTVTPNSTYFYRIRAHNSLGNSDYSGVVTATTGAGPTVGTGDGLLAQYFNGQNFDALRTTRVDPTVNFDWRTGSPAHRVSKDDFSVRWTGQLLAQFDETYTFYANADDFIRVIVNGQTLIDTYNTTGINAGQGTIDLEAGHSYAIEIDYTEQAGSASAGVQWSSASTPQEHIPQSQLFSGLAPKAPTRLAAVAAANTQIDLTWQDNSTVETGFLIERSTDKKHWSQVAIVGPDVTSYSDTALSAGVKYDYRVTAANFIQNSKPGNVAYAATPVPPLTPSGAKPTQLTAGSVSFTWKDNSKNETIVRVYRKTGQDGSFVLIASLSANTTHYTDPNLKPGTTYDYHIQEGNLAGYSDFTGFTITTPPPPPDDLQVAADAGAATLTWTAPTTATGYNIYRGTNPKHLKRIATGVTDTTFTDTSIHAGKNYYYVVTALNSGGEGPRSGAVPLNPVDQIATALDILSVAALDPDAAQLNSDPATFEVTRTGDLTSPLTVNFKLSGSAKNGVAYADLPTSVTFAPGVATADVVVTPDPSFITTHATRSVVLTLRSGHDYKLAPAHTDRRATATIQNLPTIQLLATDRSARESGSTGRFTLYRRGNLTGDLVVNLQYTGTAAAGVNYQALPATVTIPSGTSRLDLTLDPLASGQQSGSNTVIATIAPDFSYNIDPHHTQATITLLADGPASPDLDLPADPLVRIL